MKKSNKTASRRAVTTSPDSVMLRLQRSLVRDLVRSQSLSDKLVGATKSFALWRQHEMPGYGNTSPDTFKRLYQVSSFLKRYIARNDAYTENELIMKAEQNFVNDQKSYGLPGDLPKYAKEHLACAGKIASQILGEFSFEELFSKCRFGKRAANGLPMAESYLHKRVRRLTFSTDLQLDVFKFATIDDPILRRCLGTPKKIRAVSYTTVPKSYKAMRGIAPDSVLGGYLSQGLGRIVRERLEANTHIDLSRAQSVHKKVAMQASRTGKYATIDMSKASDSFTWDHVEQLVPRTWWTALRSVRTDRIIVGGKTLPLRSYMLMGSGHTFPLQTVMFYALAKAALELTGTKGKVFVFGDDIILPTKCAVPFMKSMVQLGFTINKDKSFWIGKFRESCGGDYYAGFDVRPAMPEGTYKPVPRVELAAFYLKVANGLLRRWSAFEIERTITLLCEEIESVLGYVPQGIRGIHADYSALLYDVPFYPLSRYHIVTKGGKLACAQYIIKVKESRIKIHDADPYYWDKLRTMCDSSEYFDWLAKDSSYARYCAEASMLANMGLRLPAPRVGDRYRPKAKKVNNAILLANKRHKPRYTSGLVITPILGMKGQ